MNLHGLVAVDSAILHEEEEYEVPVTVTPPAAAAAAPAADGAANGPTPMEADAAAAPAAGRCEGVLCCGGCVTLCTGCLRTQGWVSCTTLLLNVTSKLHPCRCAVLICWQRWIDEVTECCVSHLLPSADGPAPMEAEAAAPAADAAAAEAPQVGMQPLCRVPHIVPA
jgi:hypothetical protein